MKQFFFFFLFLALSCQTDSGTPLNPVPSESQDSIINLQPAARSISKQSLTPPNCSLRGTVLPTNKLWLAKKQMMVCVAADSSTFDEKFGKSHRKLAIYDASTCKLQFEWTLPINKSPDFPYYLADINYNKNSHIIAIKGVNAIHCLDVQKNKLLPPAIPTFKTKRQSLDAQSGNIVRLELWEDYLIGYAQDLGTFVFKITNNGPLKPILPYAEYQVRESKFQSLFLMPSSDNKSQAILPSYDWEKEIFSINPIFQEPVLIQNNIGSALNNQYIILKTIDSKESVGLDMKSGNNVILPMEVRKRSVQEIVAWMKTRSSGFQPEK